MSEAGPLIELREASVRYRDVTALDGVSLRVGRGQRIALIGSNGSGKTTLLRTLHGLQRCDAGGRILHADVPQAVVFQQPFLLLGATGDPIFLVEDAHRDRDLFLFHKSSSMVLRRETMDSTLLRASSVFSTSWARSSPRVT